jgi:hypothetical protein
MSPELSRRLGAALGTKFVAPADQSRIREAARDANEWDDLPPDVRGKIEEIESRPDPWS